MAASESASTSTNNGDVTRRALRQHLRTVSLRYTEKPDGIPAELDELWEEIASEIDRLDDWLSESGSIGGSLLYRGAVPVANMYTRCVRKRWQTAVDRYIENLPAACAECARTHAALDNSGIEYEIVGKCNWCKKNPADPSPDMDGCCDEDCRYHLARDEGFVTDAEHAANLLEGWVPA